MKLRGRTAVAAVALLAGSHLASAAERIALSNGFDVLCDHHAVVDDHVRVFLRPGSDDYLELKQEEINGIETVPDPPKPAPIANDKTSPPQVRAEEDGRLTASDLHQLLSKAGSEHNVDEDLLTSLVKAESGGNTRAVSRAGARGLMQLMPGTASKLGVSDSFAPEQNVRGGTAYLDNLLTRYHDNIALAVAAYNAGPEAVDRYHGIPPYHETRVYVARVIHEFNRRVYARNRAGNNTAAMLASNPRSASTGTGSE